jgi:hypothetical protein
MFRSSITNNDIYSYNQFQSFSKKKWKLRGWDRAKVILRLFKCFHDSFFYRTVSKLNLFSILFFATTPVILILIWVVVVAVVQLVVVIIVGVFVASWNVASLFRFFAFDGNEIAVQVAIELVTGGWSGKESNSF